MKTRSRLASITAVVLTLCIVTTSVSASPRDRGDHERPSIIKIIKKIAKAFGIHAEEDFPAPPKP